MNNFLCQLRDTEKNLSIFLNIYLFRPISRKINKRLTYFLLLAVDKL